MIKGILFDLDGTLVYTLIDLNNAINYALENNGLKTISIDKTKEFIGSGIKNLVLKAIDNKIEIFNEVYHDFKKYYHNNINNNSTPYNGVVELLKSLKENNIKIAVVSNKYQEGVEKICIPLFSEYSNVFIGARDNINIKPSSDMVNLALNKLNLNNNECLFVGDSNVDIMTAKNSNMKSIGVLWGYKDVSNATYKVNTPNEILDIIRKENENGKSLY